MTLQKERDLELAARIGQSLLKQKQELTARNEMLDEQLEIAKEEVNRKAPDTHLYSEMEIFHLCCATLCCA